MDAQAASKLAAVTGSSQHVTAGPGMQLLIDSLIGLSREQQLMFRTADAYILFCRRESKEGQQKH